MIDSFHITLLIIVGWLIISSVIEKRRSDKERKELIDRILAKDLNDLKRFKETTQQTKQVTEAEMEQPEQYVSTGDADLKTFDKMIDTQLNKKKTMKEKLMEKITG